MHTPLPTLMLEMAVVGVGLVATRAVLDAATDPCRPRTWRAARDTFVAGATFHLVCELLGVNAWYVALKSPRHVSLVRQ